MIYSRCRNLASKNFESHSSQTTLWYNKTIKVKINKILILVKMVITMLISPILADLNVSEAVNTLLLLFLL